MESTDEKVNSHVHAYKRARQAMVTLGADEDIMQWFKDIIPEDIKVSTDITEEVRWNQRNEVLPWFWRSGKANEEQRNNEWMNECRWLC